MARFQCAHMCEIWDRLELERIWNTLCICVVFPEKNVKKEKRYLKELCFCFLFKRGREIIQYWSQLSHVSSIFLTLKVDNEWYRNRRLATARKRPLSHKNWHFCYKTRIPCGFHIQVVEIWRRIYKTLTIYFRLLHEINFCYIRFSEDHFWSLIHESFLYNHVPYDVILMPC